MTLPSLYNYIRSREEQTRPQNRRARSGTGRQCHSQRMHIMPRGTSYLSSTLPCRDPRERERERERERASLPPSTSGYTADAVPGIPGQQRGLNTGNKKNGPNGMNQPIRPAHSTHFQFPVFKSSSITRHSLRVLQDDTQLIKLHR